MPPRAWVYLLGLLVLFGVPLGCASSRRDASGPRYRPLDELDQCNPGECVEAQLRFRHWANVSHHRGRLPYYCDPGSELHRKPDPNIRRVIFVVHGVVGDTPAQLAQLRLPPGLLQFRNVAHALRLAQQRDPDLDPDSVAIIAPNFQRTTEWQPWTDENPRVWSWDHSSYNLGNLSEYREGMSGLVKADAVSSFDVMDEFLRAAVVKFPNVEDIVIVGHSAGGQFVHRYVWMGVGVHERLEASGIRVRYVPTNPGTYAFPISQRKTPPGRDSVRPGPGRGDTLDWRWVTPRGCKDWDAWGSGLAGLSQAHGDRPVRAANYAIDHYLREQDRPAARKALRDVGSRAWDQAARRALTLMYARREVWHVQASTDLDSTFADSCEATLQGRSRYERFNNFQDAWVTRLGVATRLHFVALENASHPHSSKVVYASEAGIHLLFY
jgi:hypothetical protein